MWGCLLSWLFVMSFYWTELNRAEIIQILINNIQWDQMGFLQIHITFFLEKVIFLNGKKKRNTLRLQHCAFSFLECRKRSTRNGQQQLFHLCWQMELSSGFLCEFNTLPLFTWAYIITVKCFAYNAGLFCVIFWLEAWTASFVWTCIPANICYVKCIWFSYPYIYIYKKEISGFSTSRKIIEDILKPSIGLQWRCYNSTIGYLPSLHIHIQIIFDKKL